MCVWLACDEGARQIWNSVDISDIPLHDFFSYSVAARVVSISV